VYGQSVKHQPQRVGLSHVLADEDISESPTAVQCAGQADGLPSYHHQTIADWLGHAARSHLVTSALFWRRDGSRLLRAAESSHRINLPSFWSFIAACSALMLGQATAKARIHHTCPLPVQHRPSPTTAGRRGERTEGHEAAWPSRRYIHRAHVVTSVLRAGHRRTHRSTRRRPGVLLAGAPMTAARRPPRASFARGRETLAAGGKLAERRPPQRFFSSTPNQREQRRKVEFIRSLNRHRRGPRAGLASLLPVRLSSAITTLPVFPAEGF
jgi:hypothetical protein